MLRRNNPGFHGVGEPRPALRYREAMANVNESALDFPWGERLPGPDVQSDAEWDAYLRRTSFLGYHPVSTCRMGREGDSVVTPKLKVHGVDRLRVVDASVMPTLVSGNTNAAAIMIGERAADFILGEAA